VCRQAGLSYAIVVVSLSCVAVLFFFFNGFAAASLCLFWCACCSVSKPNLDGMKRRWVEAGMPFHLNRNQSILKVFLCLSLLAAV
jgi:hypothetical protein